VSPKTKQLLIVVIVGLVAAGANYSYLDNALSSYRNQKMIPVVRAKRDIKPGEMLTMASMETKKVPELFAPRGVVSDPKEIEGQEAAVLIAGGDYGVSNFLAKARMVGNKLSEQIDLKDNSRGVTIPVDELNSLSRSLVTGDRVDVVYSFNIPGVPQKLSVLFMQNVPIIATGSYSAAEQERGEGDSNKRYGTVTLRLSANDAMRLNYARQNGQINLLLRNPQDTANLDISPITSVSDALSGSEKAAVEALMRQSPAAPESSEKVREQFKQILDNYRNQLKK